MKKPPHHEKQTNLVCDVMLVAKSQNLFKCNMQLVGGQCPGAVETWGNLGSGMING